MSRWYDQHRVEKRMRRLEKPRRNIFAKLARVIGNAGQDYQDAYLDGLKAYGVDALSARETKPQIPRDTACRDATQTA